eukprot:TRINITY_DN881_c0_g1_i6.p1 TRINITY_DN881_c0_g1~~TRINITY_DN881_c0_g1_i6.p1  ORF type:complete len:494 (-),score=111.25 TRINITY_DN881_c0_g1_i6:387-1868(-)
MCIRDRYQRRVRGPTPRAMALTARQCGPGSHLTHFGCIDSLIRAPCPQHGPADDGMHLLGDQEAEMVARNQAAEARALGAEAALQANEVALTTALAEVASLQDKLDCQARTENAQNIERGFLVEELHAELQEATEALSREQAARERDAERIKALTDAVEEQAETAELHAALAEECASLRVENRGLSEAVKKHQELRAKLCRTEDEVELLGQSLVQKGQEAQGMREQLRRYQELLSDTEGALQSQRCVVETLRELVEGSGICQGSNAPDLQTQTCMAEMDDLHKELTELAESIKNQESARRAAPGASELLEGLRATVKQELQSELSQMWEVLSPNAIAEQEGKCTRTGGQPWLSQTRELRDLETQFQHLAEGMTDQAASISNYLSRLQRACDILEGATESRADATETFVQTVAKITKKMLRTEAMLRECLQALFGGSDHDHDHDMLDVWVDRCKPPVYVRRLQQRFSELQQAEQQRKAATQRLLRSVEQSASSR